jgi:hypothetical protein
MQRGRRLPSQSGHVCIVKPLRPRNQQRTFVCLTFPYRTTLFDLLQIRQRAHHFVQCGIQFPHMLYQSALIIGIFPQLFAV